MTNHTSKPNPRPTSEPDPTVGPAPDPEAAPGGPLHLFVLLDRSGF